MASVGLGRSPVIDGIFVEHVINHVNGNNSEKIIPVPVDKLVGPTAISGLAKGGKDAVFPCLIPDDRAIIRRDGSNICILHGIDRLVP